MIDKPFRDRFRHFEAAPPEQVWQGIASALHSDKRRKQVLWISRIAASIALLLALGTTWYLLKEPPGTQLGKLETQEAETREEGRESNAEVSDKEADTPFIKGEGPDGQTEMDVRTTARESILQETKVNLADANIPSNRPILTVAAGQNEAIPERLTPMSATPLPTDFSDPEALLAMTYYPSTVPGENEGIDVFEEWGEGKPASHDKWGVGTQVSPIYSYRNLEAPGGSAGSASYYNDVEEGIISYAGGVNVQYALLKRLSVQSGLYYSSMGMKVGNAYYARVDNGSSFMDETASLQASINNSTGIIETQKDLDYAVGANTVPQAGWEVSSQNLRANALNATEGEILQQFEYLELPLILRYRVIDRRLGFHLLGGLSSNFLVGNSAYYQEGENKEEIGATRNLRPVNYSSVVGMGVDYSISKRFHINLEPTFRYYLNSINTGSLIKSHPYTVGFFTGLLYTF
jgi:hypothetical protein